MVRALVRALIAANGSFWLAMGMFASVGLVDIGVSDPIPRLLLSALMLGNGALLALAAWGVLRGRRFVDIGAGVLLALNAALSVTDQIGAMDFVALVVNLAAIVLLLIAPRDETESARTV